MDKVDARTPNISEDYLAGQRVADFLDVLDELERHDKRRCLDGCEYCREVAN